MKQRSCIHVPEVNIEPLTGAGLRAWREERRISQTDLARVLHVRQPAIARWESGQGMWNPHAMRLALMAIDQCLASAQSAKVA